MPLPEVAAALRIPPGTAKSRLHYALAAMRGSVTAEPDTAPTPVPRRAGRMTKTNARFDRELPAILEGLYLGPIPSYRDEVLAVATHRRQRPAWAIPGRWLPMADIASRPVFAPRVPWRTVGVALVIIAILLAAIALYAGTRQTRLCAAIRRGSQRAHPVRREW
jgi:hypothetical protein